MTGRRGGWGLIRMAHGIPQTAMVLAAGYGERMRPLTDTRPKPLVQVSGRALLDYVLDKLAQAGVATAVINVHYLADQIETHLAGRKAPQIVISDERDKLLDTGGGVVKYAGRNGRYGKLVEIDHGHGLTTRYAHLAEISVRSGQIVERGSEIGLVGSTGRSTGPHLHYEVRVRNQPRDPLKFIEVGTNVFKRNHTEVRQG